MRQLYLGVDVGTGSVRAALVDAGGRIVASEATPITTTSPQPDFFEQSSTEIWEACCRSVREVAAAAEVKEGEVRGIGFDATCSLVVLGADDKPVTASPTGYDERNVVVWMDHRAQAQAQRINKGQHGVLRFVGGTISPEMEIPKVLWLKEHLPDTWKRATQFFDLPDYMTYRATGRATRSLCSLVCKWTYVAGPEASSGWDADFLQAVGLGDLVGDDYARIGRETGLPGERQGTLTAEAATGMGLWPGIPVSVSIIDAHAGGCGVLGSAADGLAADAPLTSRIAVIAGSSTCHMAVAKDAVFVPGVWGPYYSAMCPGLWLSEGGQSAAGKLLDRLCESHGAHAELQAEATAQGESSLYPALDRRVQALAAAAGCTVPELTRQLHILDYFHGNRSPLADPDLRGMVVGLTLGMPLADELALLYLAGIQALALGTRHIIESMTAAGHSLASIHMCGGLAHNRTYVQAHADATGLPVVLPREDEAVLVGASVLGACASGDFASVGDAMVAMNAARETCLPDPAQAAFYDRKFRVYRALHSHQLQIRALMDDHPEENAA